MGRNGETFLTFDPGVPARDSVAIAVDFLARRQATWRDLEVKRA